MFLKLNGTALGAKYIPPYASFIVVDFEKTILFPRLLSLHFTLIECKLIEEIFNRCMDDGFVSWLKNADIVVFKNVFNKLHPTLKFIVRKRKTFISKTVIQMCKF